MTRRDRAALILAGLAATLTALSLTRTLVGDVLVGVPFWPAILLLAVGAFLLTRKRRRWALPLGMFALWLPGPTWGRPDPDTPADLRVLTYNLASFASPKDDLMREVLAQRPDIAFFQEAWTTFPDRPPLEPLTEPPPGYHLIRFRASAILSRYPLRDVKLAKGVHFDRGGGWNALIATAETPRGPLKVATLHHRPIHFGLQFRLNRDSAAAVEHAVRREIGDGRSVIGGDFNTSRPYALQNDVWSAVGRGYGRTLFFDRADHLLTQGVTPLRAWTVNGLSDHHLLVADLAWDRLVP